MSIRQTAVPMGGMLAGFFVPMLLLRADWRFTCAVVASVSIAIALVFALVSGLVRPRATCAAWRFEALGSWLPCASCARTGALFRASCASAIYGGRAIDPEFVSRRLLGR